MDEKKAKTLTVPALKKELDARGLSTDGLKAALLARLLEALSAPEPAPAQEPATVEEAGAKRKRAGDSEPEPQQAPTVRTESAIAPRAGRGRSSTSAAAWTTEILKNKKQMENLCKIEFQHADADGSGSLDTEECVELVLEICKKVDLQGMPSKAKMHELFKKCDADGNGSLSASEFPAYLRTVLELATGTEAASDAAPQPEQAPTVRTESAIAPRAGTEEAAGAKRKRAGEIEPEEPKKTASPAKPGRPGMEPSDWEEIEDRHSQLTGMAMLVSEFE